MKYAGRCGVPDAAVIGEREAAAGTVALKDMRSGEQKSVTIPEAIEILQNMDK